jgi:uncharacterized protein DUF1214
VPGHRCQVVKHRNYRLTLPPDIPERRFWSAILYDNQTRSMLQTDQPMPNPGSQTGTVETNPDRTTDIYFGPTARLVIEVIGPRRRFAPQLPRNRRRIAAKATSDLANPDGSVTEIPPETCPNGHPLKSGNVLVGYWPKRVCCVGWAVPRVRRLIG